MSRSHRASLGRLGFVAAALSLAMAAPAQAQVGREQAAARIAEDYGVEVLRVRPGEIDGQAVWLVTVMQPGGDFNTAFQVTTLAVDQVSGELVPAYRQGTSGALGTAVPRGVRNDRRPDASRSGTWR